MRRSVLRTSLPVLTLLGVAGCAGFYHEQREWWRDQVERACLSAGLVQASAYAQPLREMDGPGSCGALRPFHLRAVSGGTVGVQPAAVLQCPMVSAFETWVTRTVQPAAFAAYGTYVQDIRLAGSYSCRNVNGARRGRKSEHSFANAVDVKAFRLADGREVTVLHGWRGMPEDQQFLQAVHDGACESFSTVLGPDSDWYHRNHFHLDLARNRSGQLRSSSGCRRVEARRASGLTATASYSPATGSHRPGTGSYPGTGAPDRPTTSSYPPGAGSPRAMTAYPGAEPRAWPVPSSALGYDGSAGRSIGAASRTDAEDDETDE